jgi:ABC-type branched-subunit amino acid transport system substrate-binding protein
MNLEHILRRGSKGHRHHGAKVVTATAAIALLATACAGNGGGSGGGGGSSAGNSTLTICADAEITGASASISAPNVFGAQAEINHINATGGLLGHQLKLVQLNNQSEPSLAAQVAQECVSKYNAWAVIGMTSNLTLVPAIPVVNEAKVPTISWSAGWNWPDSGLSAAQYEGYAFPGRATSAYSDYLMLKDVVVPKGLTRVAMIEANSAGALSAGAQVEQYVKDFHLTMTDVEQIQPNQTNVSAQVVKLLASHPQALIMNTIAGTSAVTFLQALRAQDPTIPAGVCAGCTTASFVESVGGAQDMVNTYDLGTPSMLLKVLPDNAANKATFTDINNYYAWMQKSGYTSKTDQDSGVEGWNSVEMLYDAAVSAKSVAADQVKDALQHAHDDTTGQLWDRSPGNYDNVNQQNAIVTYQADGSLTYVPSPSSS